MPRETTLERMCIAMKGGVWPVLKEDQREYVRRGMRAALQAAREPDTAILMAGFEQMIDEPTPAELGDSWRAMIDAILAEKPDEA